MRVPLPQVVLHPLHPPFTGLLGPLQTPLVQVSGEVQATLSSQTVPLTLLLRLGQEPLTSQEEGFWQEVPARHWVPEEEQSPQAVPVPLQV